MFLQIQFNINSSSNNLDIMNITERRKKTHCDYDINIKTDINNIINNYCEYNIKKLF